MFKLRQTSLEVSFDINQYDLMLQKGPSGGHSVHPEAPFGCLGSHWLIIRDIYIYTTQTKVSDHHENFHTNSIKLDRLKKEHVLKQ